MASNQFIDRVIWNGKNSMNNIASDGTYYYDVKISYNNGQEAISVPKTIRIETVPPYISVVCADKVFSPVGNGSKPTLLIQETNSGQNDDTYTASFIDAGGRGVKTYKWTGNIPPELDWDGFDDSGNLLKRERMIII